MNSYNTTAHWTRISANVTGPAKQTSMTKPCLIHVLDFQSNQYVKPGRWNEEEKWWTVDIDFPQKPGYCFRAKNLKDSEKLLVLA